MRRTAATPETNMQNQPIEDAPKFVNLQSSPVVISNSRGRPLIVQPWASRPSEPTSSADGVWVVEGDYFKQHVGTHGPLYPMPKEGANAPFRPISPADGHTLAMGDARREQAAKGDPRTVIAIDGHAVGVGEVLRGGVAVVESDEAFAARVRRSLDASGIQGRAEYEKTSASALVKIRGITSESLRRIEQLQDLIWPNSTVTASLDPIEPIGATTETEGAVGTDGEPRKKYSRADLLVMGLPELRKIIDEERFDLSKKGSTQTVRESLMDALEADDQLID